MDPDIIRRTLGLIKERREAQDFLEAQRLIDSLEEDHDNVPLTLESARVARSLGDYERAVRLANEVLKRNPGSAPARRILNQGNRAFKLSEGSSAERHRDEIGVDLAPRGLKLVIKEAQNLLSEGEPEQALIALREIERRISFSNQRWPAVQFLIATGEEALGRFEIASARYFEAWSKANTSASAEKAAGGFMRCLMETGQLSKARAFHSEWGGPQTRWDKDLFHLNLSEGDVGAAFRSYRCRPVCEMMSSTFGARYSQTLEPGSYEPHRLVFVTEAGIGDELRHSSVYSELSEYFPGSTITCDPRLQSILSRSFPALNFLPVTRVRSGRSFIDVTPRTMIHDPALRDFIDDSVYSLIEYRGYTTSLVLDVLSIIRTEAASFPPFRKTLKSAEPSELSRTAKRVGISWRSTLQSPARNVHYFSPDIYDSLRNIRELEVVCLQPLVTEGERLALLEMFPSVVFPEIDLINDFEGLGQLIASLDFCIGPGSTTTEYAGALGCQTLMISRSSGIGWRARADGTDVWSGYIYPLTCDRSDHLLARLRDQIQGFVEMSMAGE